MNSQEKRSALLGLLLIFLIVIGDIISGGIAIGSAPSDVQQFQQGTTVCSITSPNSQCTASVTFGSAFVSIPNHVSATWEGFNQGQNHPEINVPWATYFFQSDNGETWTSMPAALTEIYGNANHEVGTFLTSGFSYTAFFGITCLVASASANATLRPMWADANTGLYHEFAAVHKALDINVGQTGPCPVSPAPGFIILQAGPATIDPNFFTAGSNELAVFGLSGNGVGDNPVFNNLFVQFIVTTLQTPSICVPTVDFCPSCGPPANRKTTMIMCATIQYPPVSGFRVNMDWSAYLCIKAGTAC